MAVSFKFLASHLAMGFSSCKKNFPKLKIQRLLLMDLERLRLLLTAFLNISILLRFFCDATLPLLCNALLRLLCDCTTPSLLPFQLSGHGAGSLFLCSFSTNP